MTDKEADQQPPGAGGGVVGERLLPCPFCGGEADYLPDRLMAPGAEPPVFCDGCHASALDAAAWNRRASGWQPIETAPLDQEGLVWVANGGHALPHGKREGRIAFGRVSVYEDLPRKAYAVGYSGEWKITHWHPLPPAPEPTP
jgi:hypothetical protein